jgi:hypothetical protein
MELSDEDDDSGEELGDEFTPGFDSMPDAKSVVAVPDAITEIDNPELPNLREEMIRIEHGQRQTEVLLNRGIATVEQALGEIALMPPVYKARAMEAAAELFKAVADLNKFKVEVQIKLSDLKMKQAAFTRNKSTQPSPLGTGNTFVFNREDAIRVINEQLNKKPKEDGTDQGEGES